MTLAKRYRLLLVAAGAVVAATTTSSAQTVLTSNNGIVWNSLCIGFDCTTGMSFGFSTLVLRENNLRIFFEDTSTVAGFPTADWQITANDSASGGASKFSIDEVSLGRTPFTIRSGAPSNSLFVDSGGRVGFGTSTPSVELHSVNGDTPTLRLDQSGASGFAPHIWDVAGNETNFFVRDVTNGSTLPFRIRPGAPTNSLEIRIDGVSIGVASVPDYVFDPDYALMPLDELERFVEANSHLPSVPAADELESGGLNLGQFQMQLLQKIEELTLYVIAQHRAVGVLEERLEDLEGKLAEARRRASHGESALASGGN